MTFSLRNAMLLMAVACCLQIAKAAEKIPDGEWTVQVKPSPDNKLKQTTQPYSDVLTIKDGKLSSQVNAKYGFEPAACQLKTVGTKTFVVAEMVHEKHGKNIYELEVKGTAIAGTLQWSKLGEDGKPKSAEFTIVPAAKR